MRVLIFSFVHEAEPLTPQGAGKAYATKSIFWIAFRERCAAMANGFRSMTLALAMVTVGCVSTSKVYEVAPGVYSVTTTGDGFSTASRTRDHVLGSATDYCIKQGKHVLLVNEEQSRTRMGIDTTIDVKFRCVAGDER